MRYAIFGCTADPFTEAHQAIVSNLLTQGIVDHVIVAPTIVNYHREGKAPWLSDEQKLDIIHARLSNDAGINSLPALRAGYWSVWDKDFRIREVCSKSPALQEKYVNEHRFIDTLLAIVERYDYRYCGERKHNKYYVVLGSDSYASFTSWHMWEEIAKLAKLVVVEGRDGASTPSGPVPFTAMKISPELAHVSATAEREAWREKGFEAYKAHVLESLGKKPCDELLLHTPIFDVVRGPEVEAGFRPVKVNAPDWVAVVVMRDGKLLVETQLRHGSGCSIDELPCGMVEAGEPPRDAAARELEEETGIQLINKSALVPVGSFSPNPAFMTNTMHCYAVNLSGTSYIQVGKKLDEHEHITTKWVPAAEFTTDVYRAARCGGKVVPMSLIAALSLAAMSPDVCHMKGV